MESAQKVIFPIFYFLVLFCQSIHCACTLNSATDFVAIDPAKYDRNYSDITAVGERPYGFMKDVWYYNNPGEPNPCIKVTGANQRRVEVMIEAVPQSRLCVKKNGVELACADGGTGRSFSCKPAGGDSLYFEFYCDKQCAEHDVQFWYRIVLGETPAEDPEDHWCEDRSHDVYPESLKVIPPGFDFPVLQTTTPLNNAPLAHASTVLNSLVVMLCVAVLLL